METSASNILPAGMIDILTFLEKHESPQKTDEHVDDSEIENILSEASSDPMNYQSSFSPNSNLGI
jgi:hypothetical protein